MKRYNILYLIPILLSAFLFASCSDDDRDIDNKVYVNSSSKVETVLVKINVPNDSRSIQAALAKPEDKEVKLTFKADPSLVDTYNLAYYNKAVILPEKYYKIIDPTVIFTKGSVRSQEAKVEFYNINELDLTKTYVLPVSITDSDVNILASGRTMYYVLKEAAWINVVADIEDNYLHINTWKKPEVVNGLSEVTMEILLRARDFEKGISTIMGIEGQFLLRFGDANPNNQIQFATPGWNFPDADAKKGLPTNEWQHVALTYSSITKEVKIYVNGKVQSETTKDLGKINLGKNGENGFYIGRSWEDKRFLTGDVSEARIWNVARTAEQIANTPYRILDPTNEPGLVAYWKCDDGKGDTVKDHTANGNDLVAKEGKSLKWTDVSLPEEEE